MTRAAARFPVAGARADGMGRVLALGVLIWAGCIDFEKQTMTYRHFPKADTLVIWQQYEGIYGETEKNGLSENELE